MLKKTGYMNFLFDGTNFRGYGTEMEIVAKFTQIIGSVVNTEIIVNENENLLLKKSEIIKTENYNKNLKLFVLEEKMMKNKYDLTNGQ